MGYMRPKDTSVTPKSARPGTPKIWGFTRPQGPQEKASADSYKEGAKAQDGEREAQAPKDLGVTPKSAGPCTPKF